MKIPKALREKAGGLVQITTSRKTGARVGVYDGEIAGLDTDNGTHPWSTVCEEHGHVVAHKTLRTAIGWAPYPEEWCDTCAGIEPAELTPPTV